MYFSGKYIDSQMSDSETLMDVTSLVVAHAVRVDREELFVRKYG